MNDYTPTTEEIRVIYIGTREEFVKPWQSNRPAEFDRWLAAHDAEVRASVVAEEPEWEYRISDGEFIHYTSSQSRVTRALQRGLDVRRRIPKRDATGWEAVTDA